ncbi:MAG: YeeE/YedE thiosulfate transporter family protein, partial [Myxococcales bacterium]
GGALIGLAASGTLFFTGRRAGISGIVGGLLAGLSPGATGASPARADERRWRTAFLLGLLMGGLALLVAGNRAAFFAGAIGAPVRSYLGLAMAGGLVGFGARLGRGCTSGHGVCGVSRLSAQSLVATATFMVTGIATVALVRFTGWFAP